MRITKTQLRRIVREEASKLRGLDESHDVAVAVKHVMVPRVRKMCADLARELGDQAAAVNDVYSSSGWERLFASAIEQSVEKTINETFGSWSDPY